ncbi:MAG: hypothetical protein L0221_09195 [Chloroflexi bacterium]|nr:hypothetical protein [Chloroflexota bacterium]
MRVMDVVLSLPALVLAIGLVYAPTSAVHADRPWIAVMPGSAIAGRLTRLRD